MALENLVNVRGALAETFPQLNPETIQHSDEITSDRRILWDLRNDWFWTADFAMYGVEEEAMIYLARGKNNLIFRNMKEAIEQLVKTGNYPPRAEDIKSVVSSENTLRIRLSELGLRKDYGNDQFSYFEVHTGDYSGLNDAQKAIAKRVFGEKDFEENIEMFRKCGIAATRIYVLGPEYVKENSTFIARACRLSYFSHGSVFEANARYVTAPNMLLRGAKA